MKGINLKHISNIMQPLLILCLALKCSIILSQEDETFITDTLDNGFTYYIKPMENADGKVYMDLFIRSGTNREKNGQFQFAHFIEHLPFTAFRYKAYRDKGKLGDAIRSNSFYYNGSTTSYYTSYSYHFPSSSSFLRDEGLTFLSKTALGKVTLHKKTFEAEKGAIYQEGARVYFGSNIFQDGMIRDTFSSCQATPVFPDSLWSHFQRFELSEAKEFISKWYRPELSSLVVVGEIENINELKAKIEEKFSSTRKSLPIFPERCEETFSSYPAKFTVLDNQIVDPDYRPLVKIHLYKKEDQENSGLTRNQWNYLKPILSQSISNFLWKNHDSYNSPTNTVVRWFYDFPMLDISIKSVLGEEEQSIKQTLKFLNLLKFQGISKEDWLPIHKQGLEALKAPINKSSREWLKILKNQSLRKDQLNSIDKVHLLQWWKDFTIEDYNYSLRKLLSQDTKDFLVIAPFSSGFDHSYWKEKTLEWLSKYDPNFHPENQLKQQTTYKEIESDAFGARVFQLENGQKVVLKEFPNQTEGKEFLEIHAFRNFGASHLDPKNYHAAMLSPEIIQNAGYGVLNKYELKDVKALNSIQKLTPYVIDRESGVKGQLNGQNISIFFDLIQDYINTPRRDSKAFKDWQLNEWHRYLNPGIGRNFSDTKSQVEMILKLPRKNLGVLERYQASKKINMENAYAVYDTIFGWPEEFTILISSSYKAEKILPYIANIFDAKPKIKRVDKSTYDHTLSKSVDIKNEINVSSIPNSNAILALKYLKTLDKSDWKTRIQIEILKKILSDRIHLIRFYKNKALYNWKVAYYFNKESDQASLSILIPTLKEQVNEVSNEVENITRDLKRNKISEDELDKLKNSIIRPKYSNNWEQNPSKTIDVLYNYYRFNMTPPQKEELEDYIKSISPKDIKAMAKEVFTKANKKEFIGLP